MHSDTIKFIPLAMIVPFTGMWIAKGIRMVFFVRVCIPIGAYNHTVVHFLYYNYLSWWLYEKYNVSLVKYKFGDTNNVNNYRPIALVTIIFLLYRWNFWQRIWVKLLKTCLYLRRDILLSTVCLLIQYYKRSNSPCSVFLLSRLYILQKRLTESITGHFLENC